MGIARIVSLRARPYQVSHLCFDVGGILGEWSAPQGRPNAPVYTPLGESVSAFDFSAFYALLGSMPTVPDHPSRLLYDFEEIQAAVNQYTIVALRAEAGKAILDKAINARQNAFYAKYANVGDIIDRIRKNIIRHRHPF